MSETPPVAAFPSLPPGSVVRGDLYLDPAVEYLSGDVLEVELPGGRMIDVGWDEERRDAPFRIAMYREYYGNRSAEVMAKDVGAVMAAIEGLIGKREIMSEPGPEVYLTHGGSFAGETYKMKVGETWYDLCLNLGGKSGDDEAREKAREILAACHPDLAVDVDAIPFRWDGCL